MRRSTYWFRTFDRGVIRESAKESSRTRQHTRMGSLARAPVTLDPYYAAIGWPPMLVPGEPGCGLVVHLPRWVFGP